MSQITIIQIAGELVVDSRIIAEQLENEHHSLMSLLKKHQTKIEKRCGHLRFEIGTVTNSVGAVNEVKFAWLNEKQSAALLNLCRNTDRAVDLKIDLAEISLSLRCLCTGEEVWTQVQTGPGCC